MGKKVGYNRKIVIVYQLRLIKPGKMDHKESKTGITLKEAIYNATDIIGIRDSYPNSFYPSRAGRMLPLFGDVLKIPPGKLLDIGCGVGFMAAVLSQFDFEVHCLDAFNDIDEEVIRKFNLRYSECNVEFSPIPYDENYFDVVILADVLEHFNYNPLVPLKEIYRILKPGGSLFITTPNVASIFSFYTLLFGDNVFGSIESYLNASGWRESPVLNSESTVQNPLFRDRHVRLYTMKEIEYLMNLSGFITVKHKYIASIEPSTRSFPRYIYHFIGRRIVTLTNSRLLADVIYIIARKPVSKEGT
jgi:2-polyprenyl-3-methyl-5-hydroxy-6-metoxy-1,4-benzoquinol methylase